MATRYEEQGRPRLWPAGVQTVHGRLSVVFLLRRRDTGGVVHRYATEGAALGFVRDVLRVGGREQAAGFALEQLDQGGQARTLAQGAELVRRAVEDRAEQPLARA